MSNLEELLQRLTEVGTPDMLNVEVDPVTTSEGVTEVINIVIPWTRLDLVRDLVAPYLVPPFLFRPDILLGHVHCTVLISRQKLGDS